MSYPIESFPESKKEFELIENVSSNRGNKLKRGVEYIHRKDMAWTSEGFKPIGNEQSNKTEAKSEFKANALKNVKGNKEGKTSTPSLLTTNATQPHSSQPKPQDYTASSPYEQNSHTTQQQARNLEIYKKQSISFIASQKTPTENYCKNILSFIQQEFEFRKGLEKLADFINNKEFDEGSKEGESSEFKRVKRRAMELAEEVNYNTTEFERFLKLSRSKLLKTISNINDYSSIVIAGGDPEQIKLMEINNGGKKFSDAAGGKYSKSGKNGSSNKSKLKSSAGVGGVGPSGTKPTHGNSKGAGTSNKPKAK